MRDFLRIVAAVVGATAMLTASLGWSQDISGSEGATRYPASGIPILNCEPSDPAPENTCLLRLLPGFEVQNLDSEPLGEVEGRLRGARPGSRGFPDDIDLSATLILIDLSPGPRGGRRPTFEAERELVADIVRNLPNGEQVSIYGFNESLQRIIPFSDDRSRALDAVQSIELQGSNTRIGAFVTDGISILEGKEDVLFRNLILISDGQEEGRVDVSGVVEQAIEAQVVISAVGMFWRAVGAEETSTGMDYLRLLTNGTSGASAQAILRNGETASENVDRFVQNYSDAIEASRLIVPEGDPQPTEIKLALGEPALGAEGEFTTRNIVVRYEPMVDEVAPDSAATVTSPDNSAEEDELLYGYPANYVYAAAAVAVLFVFLLIILLLRGRRKTEDAFLPDVDEDLDFASAPAVEPTVVASPPTVAVPRAQAYLVFDATHRQVGLTGEKNNVGRSATNDVVIEVEGISRLHAQIFRNRDGGYSITDMDSLNGSFVNGKKVVGSVKVQLGDTLTFGTVSAKLVSA